MATEIANNGASLKITSDASPRFIMKSQIREIEVVRDTIIKIDIGQGALNNVFIDQVDVTLPVSKSVDDLRDQIMEMLQGGVAGLATEQKQTDEIQKISALQEQVKDVQNKIGSVDSKLFFDPALVDESNANVVFKGYAVPGAKTADAVWAIKKIIFRKGVLSYQWAEGNKNFDKVWDNRQKLIFS